LNNLNERLIYVTEMGTFDLNDPDNSIKRTMSLNWMH